MHCLKLYVPGTKVWVDDWFNDESLTVVPVQHAAQLTSESVETRLGPTDCSRGCQSVSKLNSDPEWYTRRTRCAALITIHQDARFESPDTTGIYQCC